MILYDQNTPDSSIISYDSLDNKPLINGVMLEGNKTLSELGITSLSVFNQQNDLFRLDLNSLRGSKQDKLISGVNIKTVMGQELLGNGDIPIPSNYITEDELNAKGYLTSVPANYVTFDAMYSEDYATEHYVDTRYNAMQTYIDDVSVRLKRDYFTKREFEQKQEEFVLKTDVDAALSDESENPVQNKVITDELANMNNLFNQDLDAIRDDLTSIRSNITSIEDKNRVQDASITDVNSKVESYRNNMQAIAQELNLKIQNNTNNISALAGDKISIGDASMSVLQQVMQIQVLTEDEYLELDDINPSVLYVIKKY